MQQPTIAKRCVKCREWKLIDEFSRARRAKDGRQPQCKKCAAAYFQANKAKIIPKVRERQARIRAEVRQAIWDYFCTHPCIDCGEADPVVLEFDHVRGEKRGSVANLTKNHDWPVIMAEIAKCEVRCANCHRRRTARQLDWYRGLLNDPTS